MTATPPPNSCKRCEAGETPVDGGFGATGDDGKPALGHWHGCRPRLFGLCKPITIPPRTEARDYVEHKLPKSYFDAKERSICGNCDACRPRPEAA